MDACGPKKKLPKKMYWRGMEVSSKTGRGVEQAGYALCDAAMQLRAERRACGWAPEVSLTPEARSGAFLEGTHGHTQGMKWGAAFEKGCCVQ